VYLFYFGVTCSLTNYLTYNQLCNTLTGTTREDKVASLDLLHLQALQAVAAMKPKPQMIKNHEAFLKGYLELFLFRQQYGTIRVPWGINKSLNEWLHNQRTYIGDYKKQSRDP
jgi:hypothetical protein